ncbi:uncharacterized protein VP01_1249g3 [Puccinia sorghi]|uniref:Uncharacterized protein n=1 Tax=Puccinia sorghi TaxID=27349 RepID=A0A0L6VPF9_9BASI|nr:uncharacterized protein VP01_1249g3 [Puccinia sorghi]
METALQSTISITTPILAPNIPQATFTPSFLIYSGSAHNILIDSYARRLGLLPYAKPTHRTVSGFDTYSIADQPLTYGPGSFICGPNSTLAPSKCEFFAGQPSPLWEIWKDAEIVNTICRAGPADQDYTTLMDSALSPASQSSNPKL